MRRRSDVSNAQADRLAGIGGLSASPWGRPLISELLESIPDPVIGCDVEGHVVYWSRAAREAYGYSADEALGEPVVALLRTRFPAPLMEIMEEVTDLGHWQGRLLHRTKDGRQVAVESRWVARYDDAGGLVGGFGIERATIATSRPRRNAIGEAPAPAALGGPGAASGAGLRQAERLANLAQLTGGVAHDFNNALAIIVNYAAFVAAELGRLRGSPTEQQRESLQRDLAEVADAAGRAVELNNRLLAYVRQVPGPPQPQDLNDVIREQEPLLAHTVGGHVEVAVSAAEGLPPVSAAGGELEQVLVSLAANARDAMANGGTLTIETAPVELDARTLGAVAELAPGPYVRLRVSDTGDGMPPEVQEHAFEPFFTTRDRGTGLGLSGVQGIINRRGGHVRFHSEPGVGTSFVALLPAADRGQRAQTTGEPQAEPATGTVLVVDDERALREIVRRVLTEAGYEVLVAASGEQALALADTHEGTIDLVLTDVVMPGMLGPELAQRVQERRPAAGIAYMSGFAETVLGPAADLEPGVLLDKPFTAAALLAHVRGALPPADGRRR
ncbi:MAG: ATP-binding protein [Solirubrobacteraceae bacterium]